MAIKYDYSDRERKTSSNKKTNDTTGMFSNKNITCKNEQLEWKKKNNRKKGSKSRHIKYSNSYVIDTDI